MKGSGERGRVEKGEGGEGAGDEGQRRVRGKSGGVRDEVVGEGRVGEEGGEGGGRREGRGWGWGGGGQE